MEEKVIYKKLSYRIVGILFEVYNELGYGYKIKFKNKDLGVQYLDFLIEDKIILELKKGNYFSRKNIEQVRGYLKVTNKKLAILANYTSKGVKTMRILNIK